MAVWVLAALLWGTWMGLGLRWWARRDARWFNHRPPVGTAVVPVDDLDRAFAESVVIAADRYREARTH